MFFEYIFANVLHFGAVFDAHGLSEFVDLMAAVVPVASVVAILESEVVLCGFGEKED